MKIIELGTDISIETCKKEGYLIIEYFEGEDFDPYECYRIKQYAPSYIKDELLDTYVKDGNDILITDTSMYNFIDLKELYLEYKEKIDNFAETDKTVNFENPTYNDFLNLANDIHSYCGL